MATHSTLVSLFTDIADAIRAKTGGSGKLTADNFPTAIAGISTGTDTGDATAAAGDIRMFKTAYVKGAKVTGSMPIQQGGYAVTPRTFEQTAILDGACADGDILVAGDANLVAGNIRSGVSIFGVTGSFAGGGYQYLGGATATASRSTANTKSITFNFSGVLGTLSGATAVAIFVGFDTSVSLTTSSKIILSADLHYSTADALDYSLASSFSNKTAWGRTMTAYYSGGYRAGYLSSSGARYSLSWDASSGQLTVTETTSNSDSEFSAGNYVCNLYYARA